MNWLERTLNNISDNVLLILLGGVLIVLGSADKIEFGNLSLQMGKVPFYEYLMYSVGFFIVGAGIFLAAQPKSRLKTLPSVKFIRSEVKDNTRNYDEIYREMADLVSEAKQMDIISYWHDESQIDPHVRTSKALDEYYRAIERKVDRGLIYRRICVYHPGVTLESLLKSHRRFYQHVKEIQEKLPLAITEYSGESVGIPKIEISFAIFYNESPAPQQHVIPATIALQVEAADDQISLFAGQYYVVGLIVVRDNVGEVGKAMYELFNNVHKNSDPLPRVK